MNQSPIQHPTWPLGCVFVDSLGDRYHVIQTIFGDPENNFSFRIDLENGWSIISQGDSYPQTAVGFVAEGSDSITVETVIDMDEYVKNGHLQKG